MKVYLLEISDDFIEEGVATRECYTSYELAKRALLKINMWLNCPLSDWKEDSPTSFTATSLLPSELDYELKLWAEISEVELRSRLRIGRLNLHKT